MSDIEYQRFVANLSRFAASEIREMADKLGVKPGRLVSQQLENLVASPSFGAWKRRVNEWAEQHPQASTEDLLEDSDG